MLRQPLESVDAVRARKPERLPTVLAKNEALRVKDLDFERRCLTVRDGKGEKDRVTYTHVLNRGGLAVRRPLD